MLIKYREQHAIICELNAGVQHDIGEELNLMWIQNIGRTSYLMQIQNSEQQAIYVISNRLNQAIWSEFK